MARSQAAACAAQPQSSTPSSAPGGMDLGSRLALTHYGLGELQRRVRALAAIEQLLRVPVPDDSAVDNGAMSRVWRDDLGALLSVVCAGLEEKADFAKKLARESWEQLHGCPMPAAED